MLERIAKKTLNIILLVDTSKSMQGKRIKQVNDAILDIKDYLCNLQVENTEVDFDLTIIPFSTTASFYNRCKSTNIADYKFTNLTAGGWSNLHLAYEKLADIMKCQSKGGIMPDFGGLSPIILLLSDGHPTKEYYKSRLEKLKKLPWFNASLKFAVAIGLDDKKTIKVLEDFTGNEETVLSCINSDHLKQIIKVVVVTSSMIKSQHTSSLQNENEMNSNIIQTIINNLEEVNMEDW